MIRTIWFFCSLGIGISLGYYLIKVFPKQKHEAKVRNNISGTRKMLYRNGKLTVFMGCLAWFIYLFRSFGWFPIDPELYGALTGMAFVGTFILVINTWAKIYSEPPT